MAQSIVRWFKTGKWRRAAAWLLGITLLAVVVFYGARAILVDSRTPVHLVVYGFSTQEEVFTQGIFPAFEAVWEAQTGQDLTLEGVFGPSGSLAGQINLGAPADVALFSNAEHANWLRLGRRVRQDTEPVVFGCTPMVVVARPGNPAGIAQYADMGQEGLRLIHPDPRTSGAGEWGVVAEYGSELLATGDPAEARGQLDAIWDNVRLLAPSARAAMTLFELGAGDALLTYEQDARLALARGVSAEIVAPPHTVIAQPVAMIVDDNVTAAERPVAEAFVRYLLSDPGQQILEQYHMRPVDCVSDLFPHLVQPFTVDDLGGWSQAYAELVQALWEAQIEPRLRLEQAPGVLDSGE